MYLSSLNKETSLCSRQKTLQKTKTDQSAEQLTMGVPRPKPYIYNTTLL